MNSLKRIEISGFKSIREMSLDLSSLNILVGANGAGKSNFIAIFKLLNQIVEENLELFVSKSGGPETLLYFGQKTTKQISIGLDFGSTGYDVTLTPARNNLIFSDENYWYHESAKSRERLITSLGKGHRETKLLEEAGKPGHGLVKQVLEKLKSYKIYHFQDVSDSAAVKKLGDIGDNAIFKSDASNLAAFLHALRVGNRNYYDSIVKTIRLAAPFFKDFTLRPSPLNRGKIKLEWREKDSDDYFDAYALSDGTLRFICLATLLLQPALPSTILLDEPELGLHPYALTLLASMLKSAATRTQLIVSTQSVPLVNQFALEDLIIVDREDEQSTFRRLEAQKYQIWLEEYGVGELWEKNVIGGRPQR